MNQRFLMAAAGLALAMVTGAASAQDYREALVEDGVLTVGTSGSAPPFSMTTPTGDLAGFDVDVLAFADEGLADGEVDQVDPVDGILGTVGETNGVGVDDVGEVDLVGVDLGVLGDRAGVAEHHLVAACQAVRHAEVDGVAVGQDGGQVGAFGGRDGRFLLGAEVGRTADVDDHGAAQFADVAARDDPDVVGDDVRILNADLGVAEALDARDGD